MSAETLALAQEYLARGWASVPSPKGTKKPVLAGWPTLRLTSDKLAEHYSNGNNIGLILGEPSDGLVDLDLDCNEAVTVAPFFAPPTRMWGGRGQRPRSHAWFIAKGNVPTRINLSDPRIKAEGDRAVLVELCGTGRQTIVAPSVHPSGDVYCWNGSLDPEPVDGDVLVRVLHRIGAAALLARCWPKVSGTRDDIAMALSGMLLRGGWSIEETEVFVEAVATAGGDDEIGKRVKTVRKTAATLEKDEPATGGPRLSEYFGVEVIKAIKKWLGIRAAAADAEHQTELGLADRIVREHGDKIRFVWGWDSWLAWNGLRWTPKADADVWQMAKATVRPLLSEAGRLPEGDARKAAVKFAMIAERERTMRAALNLARCEPGISLQTDEINRDMYLLNTVSGTVDLRTGKMQPHETAALLTKLCTTPYDPAAIAPTFERFLLRIFGGDIGTILFVQRLFGYAATGSCREHILPIFWGAGANGKSTLTTAIIDVLGPDYAGPIAHSLLFAETKDSHPTAVADLYGKRVAVTHELDGGTRLAEGLVKNLTGGDRIKARRMREDLWEFTPTHTLILATNTKPVVRGTDDGIWRRLKLVPFTVQIPESERDTGLGDKLRAEAPGILTWIVQGAREWYAHGLETPETVKTATTAYRSASDVIGEFIAARCKLDPLEDVQSKMLYENYVTWHKDELGGEPWTQNTFGRRLTDRGFVPGRNRAGERAWKGIYLAPTVSA